MKDNNFDDKMLEDIIKHLDKETSQGSVRMSVEYDENTSNEKDVSHKACKIYGKNANDIVNMLDMYTDLHMDETIDNDKK